MTLATCSPHPAQVILPQRSHRIALHMNYSSIGLTSYIPTIPPRVSKSEHSRPACAGAVSPRGTVEAYLRSAVFTVSSALVPSGTRLKSSLMRATVLVASLAIAVVALTFAPAGNAFAAQAVEQCNGDDNTGGLGLTCTVDIVNTLNVDTGEETSVVTTEECHGAANTAPSQCDKVVNEYNTLTTSVNQCNDSANGAGASVICSVTVTNKIVGADSKISAREPATVNQCNGSGAEGSQPTLNCDPYPANETTSPTVTQCNGTANGGGAPERVECSVPESFISAQFPMIINQCNGTANGGGAVVDCDATIITPAGATTPTPIDNTPIKNTLHDSQTDGIALADNNGTAFLGAGVLMLLAGGLLTAAFATRKAGARR